MMVEPLREVPGIQSQNLPGTHDEGLLVGDAAQLGSGGHAGAALNEDKCDTVDDEHQGHGNAVVQMSIQPIIQQQAPRNRSRDAGYNDLAPQTHHWPAEMPGKTGIPAIVGAERPQLFEMVTTDRQNRAQLDDHAEHLHKLGAETEFKNLLR